MARPDFTAEEQYLLSFLRSQEGSRSNAYMWGYLIGGGVVAVVGAYQQDPFLAAAAFAIVFCFRVYEERYGARWNPVWRSIIEKYDAAVAGCEQPGTESD